MEHIFSPPVALLLKIDRPIAMYYFSRKSAQQQLTGMGTGGLTRNLEDLQV